MEQAVLARLGDRARSLPVETLLELDDPREFARGLGEVFSTFRRTAEKKMALGNVRPGVSSLSGGQRPDSVPLGSIPTLAELGMTPVASNPRGVLEFQGGESAALARLHDWIFNIINNSFLYINFKFTFIKIYDYTAIARVSSFSLYEVKE